MTLVSEIIEKAYRETDLLGELNNPTPKQASEGLARLQTIASSVIGNEIGELLQAFPIGRNNINRPQGYPYYEGVPDNTWFVPINTRVMLNLTESVDLYLSPQPYDGSRFGLIDVSKNTSTYPVTVHGNGRTIETDTEVVINTNGADIEWFYRDDLGDWLKSMPLGQDDVFPFPSEFDEYFIISLAVRLSPAYAMSLTPASQFTLSRSRSQILSRYAQHVEVPSELGLIVAPMTSQDRYWWWYNRYYWSNPSSAFNSGYPWG